MFYDLTYVVIKLKNKLVRCATFNCEKRSNTEVIKGEFVGKIKVYVSVS